MRFSLVTRHLSLVTDRGVLYLGVFEQPAWRLIKNKLRFLREEIG